MPISTLNQKPKDSYIDIRYNSSIILKNIRILIIINSRLINSINTINVKVVSLIINWIILPVTKLIKNWLCYCRVDFLIRNKISKRLWIDHSKSIKNRNWFKKNKMKMFKSLKIKININKRMNRIVYKRVNRQIYSY